MVTKYSPEKTTNIKPIVSLGSAEIFELFGIFVRNLAKKIFLS